MISRPKGIESLNEMKDTLGALPEFQEMKSKFSLHINICQQCKTMLGEKRIDACAAVEQVGLGEIRYIYVIID